MKKNDLKELERAKVIKTAEVLLTMKSKRKQSLKLKQKNEVLKSSKELSENLVNKLVN